MTVLLVLPAVVVTICFFVILFGIENRPGADRRHRRHRTAHAGPGAGDGRADRRTPAGSRQPARVGHRPSRSPRWSRSCRYEARHPDPIIDVRLFAQPGQWPVQLTAFLFGMSVLGAQIPLSTFARPTPRAALASARTRRSCRR